LNDYITLDRLTKSLFLLCFMFRFDSQVQFYLHPSRAVDKSTLRKNMSLPTLLVSRAKQLATVLDCMGISCYPC